MKQAKGIQKEDPRTIAKINIGITPFNPAVIIVSVGKRLAMEVKIQAINKTERLNPAEIPASFHASGLLGIKFN